MAQQGYRQASGATEDCPQLAEAEYTIPTREAARRLGMVRGHLRYLVAQGRIGAVRRDGRLWFSEREVAAFTEAAAEYGKLTRAQAAEIRAHLAAGELSKSGIAAIYGVSQWNVTLIERREIWRDVEAAS